MNRKECLHQNANSSLHNTPIDPFFSIALKLIFFNRLLHFNCAIGQVKKIFFNAVVMLFLSGIIVLHCDTVFVCVCAVIYYAQDFYGTQHLQSIVKSFKEPLLYCLRQVSECSCLSFLPGNSATQGVLNDWPKTTSICGKPGN